MSPFQDNLNGTANKVAGKIKEAIGNASDNPQLEGEGKAQQIKGDLQKAAGKAKSAAADGMHAAGNAIKKAGDKIEHLGE